MNKKNEKILPTQALLIEQLKERRKSLGMTQRELADLVGVPQSQIGRMEAGVLSPRIDTMIKIGEALNLSFTYKIK